MSGLTLNGTGLSLVAGAVTYQGTWNASTNTPTLASGVGTPGYYYIVSVAGTTTLDGISSWSVGDWVVFSGAAWQKVEGAITASEINAALGFTLTGTAGRTYTFPAVNSTLLYDGGALGTPASGVATNLTGTAAGLTAGTVTTNANLTGPVTSVGNVTTIAASPALTTPIVSSVAIASLPAASTAGQLVRASNFGVKGSLLMADGTRWKPLNGSSVLKTLDAQTGNIANVETIVFQYLFPAALWTVGDRVRLFFGMIKSGTTNTGDIRVRIGAAGTTGDSALISLTTLTAAQRQLGFELDLQLVDATHVIALPSSRALLGYGTPNTTAYDSSLAVPNATSAGFYVTVTILSGGVADTVAATHAEFNYIASGN